jgi:hypothetical protein
MALFNNPIIRNAPQIRGLVGTLSFLTQTTIHSASIAQKTRCRTEVMTGIVSNATRIEIKDAPQITPRSNSSAQALGDRCF